MSKSLMNYSQRKKGQGRSLIGKPQNITEAETMKVMIVRSLEVLMMKPLQEMKVAEAVTVDSDIAARFAIRFYN